MICGNCKNHHKHVAAVRACYEFDRRRPGADPFDVPASAPKPIVRDDWNLIPASKYALVNERGELEFYEVDSPKRGKWAGYKFVKRLYGAPGTWREVDLRGTAGTGVLRRILTDKFSDLTGEKAGAEAAALRFARRFTVCAVCSSPLSDPISITRGLGPICAGRF